MHLITHTHGQDWSSSFGGEQANKWKLRCVFTWFDVFRPISLEVLDRFSQSFHNMKALYVPIIDRYLIFRFLGRCHGNHIICERQVRHGPKKWHILSNISGYTGPIFAIFSPYESSWCTNDGSVPFFSKFGELPSSNLGVYAVKTRNFCRHAPAILGRSSYVTLAFRNGLEDRNFDFSRVIGKHFGTPYRNLVRFGSVTPEFKT